MAKKNAPARPGSLNQMVTLRIPPDLRKRVRIEAAKRDLTISALWEMGIRQLLDGPGRAA